MLQQAFGFFIGGLILFVVGFGFYAIATSEPAE